MVKKRRRSYRRSLIVGIVVFVLFGVFFSFGGWEEDSVFNNFITGLGVGIDSAGEDINISSNTTWNSTQTYDNIYVSNNSVLLINSTEGGNVSITINAQTITVDSGSKISADGTGHHGAPNTNAAGNGPGGGTGGGTAGGGGGGGHGGKGGDSSGGQVGGAYYGNGLEPLNMGSAGGNCHSNKIGSSGGGAIRLNISNSLTLNGIISAEGIDGILGSTGRTCGAGAGGSIYVNVGTLSGTGNFSAIGGNGFDRTRDSGSGGGGRIAVYYNSSTVDFTASSVVGGVVVGANQPGFSGSLIFVDQDDNIAHIYGGFMFSNETGFDSFDIYNAINLTAVDAPNINANASPLNFSISRLILEDSYWNSTNVSLNSTVEINLTNSSFNGSRVNISTVDMSIDGTSLVASNGLGYHGDDTSSSGSGGGQGGGSGTGGLAGGGGGHGGKGGDGSSGASGGITYGNSLEPTTLGSAGGSSHNTVAGGTGGGVIRLNVTNDFILNGVVSANGHDSSGGTSGRTPGGGAGGSIYVTTYNLSGNGNFSAIGGLGQDVTFDGGSGGGGRIAVYYNISTISFGSSSIYGGGAMGGGIPGQNGTLIYIDRDDDIADIYGGFGFGNENGFDSFNISNVINLTGTGATNIYGNVSILNFNVNDLILNGSWWNATNVTIIATNNVSLVNSYINGTAINISVPNFTLDSNSVLAADGTGYYGNGTSTSASGDGPGGGGSDGFAGAGGGHGGAGGDGSSGASGGGTYGNDSFPISMGSAGGSSHNKAVGGNGGGVIRVIVNDLFIFDGIVRAEGGNSLGGASGRSPGGGAGGGIYVTAYNLTGSGNVSAIGGLGQDSSYDGGSGGGGRIAILYNLTNFTNR